MKKVLLRTFSSFAVFFVLLVAFTAVANPNFSYFPTNGHKSAVKDATSNIGLQKSVEYNRFLGKKVQQQKLAAQLGVTEVADCQVVKKVYTVDDPGAGGYRYSGGIDYFTVPAGVSEITIEAYGANGGDAFNADQQYTDGETGKGGVGAYLKARYSVTTGQRLAIMVGQRGGDEYQPDLDAIFSAGGGGGSFVAIDAFDTDVNKLLLAAGGGGGGGYGKTKITLNGQGENVGRNDDRDANIVTAPNYGAQESANSDIFGGVGGSVPTTDGHAGYNGSNSGGGAGYLDGGSDPYALTGAHPAGGGWGGYSFFSDFYSDGYLYNYGGAGGGGGTTGGGGGGGGYSGGAGGKNAGFGGGAGSYINTAVSGYVAGSKDAVRRGNTNNPHDAHGNGAVVISYKIAKPIINVFGNNTAISNGQTSYSVADLTEYGNATTGGSSVHTFEIRNTGTADLNIGNITVSDPNNFSNTQAVNGTLARNASTTFTVTFNPLTDGLKTATITINNDDQCTPVYKFNVEGTGQSSTPVSPGSIGSPQTICRGAGSAALTSLTDASGGTGTISYQWQSSTDGNTFTNISGATASSYSPGVLTASTYYRRGAYTSTDAIQYTGSVLITVNTTPIPTITANGPTTFCDGGSVVLTSSAATGNVWSTGATTQSITVTAAGTYGVEVTANGCSANSTGTEVNVTPKTTPTFSQVEPICAGGSFTLPATSDNGISGTWSPAINNTTTTTYTFTPNAGQCASTTTMTVVVNTTPIPTISASGSTTFCEGGSVTLTSSAATGNVWSTGATTQSIEVAASGTYGVEVTANGCSANSLGTTVTVTTKTTPTFTQVAAICAGGSFTLPNTSTNGISGTWSPAISNTTTTTYTFTPNAGQCANTTTMTVVVNSKPATPVVTVADNCDGTSTLSTTASGSLLWSTGSTAASISVSAAGTYSVTQSVNGCVSAAGSGVASPKTAPAAPVLSKSDECGRTLLSATAAGSILWSNGSTANDISVTVPGTYTATQSINGCVSVAASIVAAPKQKPDAPTVSGAATICEGNPLNLTASSTAPSPVFKWYEGNGGGAIYTGANFVYNDQYTNTTYTVEVISNGCVSDRTTVNVVVNSTPAPVTYAVTNNCDGTSVISATNIAPGASILWSTGATTSSITVNSAGTYSATQSLSGCTSAVSNATAAPKTKPSTPVVTVVDNCDGTSTLSTTATGSLLWSTGSTASSITVSSAGTYTVTRSVNDCVSDAGAGVAAPKTTPVAPVVAVVDNCNNTSTLSTSATGSLLWSTGATTSSITVSSAGTYTVTQSVNGCVSAAGSGVATPKSAPSISVSVDGSSSFCVGATKNIFVGSSDVTLVSYQWFKDGVTITGATDNNYNATESGVYTVQGTTADGCSSVSEGVTLTTTAPPAVPVITVPASICDGGMSSISATPGNGVWSSSNLGVVFISVDPIFHTATIRGEQAGAATISYKVTDANGCFSTASQSVTVLAKPDAGSISGPATVCVGGTVQMNATLPNGVWMINGDAGISAGGVVTGNQVGAAEIYYYITDANGCQNNAYATIQVVAPPTATITASGATTFCPGGSVVLHANAGSGYTYQWQKNGSNINGANGADYTATATGAYTVIVTSNSHCAATSDAVSVSADDVTAPVKPTLPNITAECSATATAPVTTDACAGNITGTTTDPLTYTTQGDHVIHWTFTDPSGNTTTADQHVIITDVTRPTIACPSNITRSATTTANGYGAMVTYTATASDNCGTPTVTYSPASGSYFPVGTTTVTVTANDGHGNTNTCHFDVTVIAPEINITGNRVTIVDGDATPSTTDNTDFGNTLPGSPIVKTFTIQNTGNDDLNVSAITISGVDAASFTVSGFNPTTLVPGASTTFNVTFAASATGVKNATVTVSNNDFDESSYDFAITANINCATPVFTNCPTNITQPTDAGVCSAVVNYTTSVSGIPAPSLTYTFSGATTGSGSGNGSGATFNKGVTTVTITAGNGCGSVVCSFTITVEDHEIPVITNVPNSISKGNDAGQCGAVVTFTAPTFTDNCPGVTWTADHQSGDVFPIGTTTIHYTATDASGNKAYASFNVTVNDTENPTITIPSDVNHTADAGRCSYKFANSVTDINTVTPDGPTPGYGSTAILLGTATGTDNCGATTVAGVRSDGLALTDPYPVGTTTVTWTVTDSHGRTATGVQTIVITDDESPVIHNLPANITQSADLNSCGAVVNWTAPTTTDNCAVTLTTNHAPGETFAIGTTVVTYKATDSHGHETTGSFNVTVTDDQAPTIACPGNITVAAEAGKNGANVTYTATATDNCGTVTVTYSIAPGSLFAIGTTTVTATATDAKGNQVSCSFDVIVTNNPPVANPDVNTTTEDTPVSGNVLTNDTDIDGHTLSVTGFVINGTPYTPGQTATFTEGSLVLNADGTYTYTPAANFDGAVPVVTYSITDGHGGTASTTLTINVTPVNDAPVANPDTNTTQEDTPVSGNVLTNDSDVDGDALTVTGYVINGVPYTPGTIAIIAGIGDLVINADGSYTYTPAPNYNGPVPVVTYSITDGHGGTASSTLTINVTPVNDIPVAVNDAATVNEDAVLNATVRTNDTESGDGGNTWSVVTSTTHGTLVFNNDGTYTYTPNANFNGTDAFTYKVCDIEGDCSTATVTITVVSVNDVPVAVDDAATTNEDVVLNGSVIGNDTPSPDGGNVWSLVSTTTHGTLVFNNDGTYTYTPNANFHGTDVFTYKLCDVDGDCVTATVTITVVSVNDPAVMKVKNITVYVDANGHVSITAGQIDDGSYDPDGIASLTLDKTDFSCGDIATSPNTVTLTLVDGEGNSTSANATVTVLDVIPPTISCPAPVTVQCAASVPAPNVASVTAADNCAVVVSFVNDVISNQVAPNKYTITRTYKAIDPSGNTAYCSQLITVNDNTAPTLIVANSLPGNTTGQCLGDVPAAPTAASIAALYTDNCSGAVTAVLSNTTTTGTNATGWTRKYYYTITDASGNSTTACVTYSGRDTQAPVPTVATLPTVTGQCAASVTAPTATDNCAGTVTATTTSPLSYTAQGTYTITWTYSDGNGNTSTQTQTVVVKDNIKPTINCPSDITLTANTTVSGQAGANVTYSVTATDNCGTPSITYSKASGSFFPVGTTVVTATADDGNGNTATCSFKVIVNCTAPSFTTCPSNITKNTDAGLCSAVVTYSSASTAIPNANCSYTFTGATTGSGSGNGSGKVFNRGVTNVTITATNLCGTTTCNFTVTVVDNEKPSITAPSAVSVVNDAGKCGATIASIGNAETSDNCGVASVTNNHPSTYYPVGKTIVTWTVTDVNGNVTDTAKQCITVIDNEIPTISATNVTVGSTAGLCGANLTLAAPVTGDNCGVASVTNDHPSTFFPVGTTTVTWTVTDNAGWTNTTKQTVTITDAEKPVITCPGNVTIACGLAPTPANAGTATAVDNCGGAVTITYTDVVNGNITQRTWKATDAAGNFSTCVQTITVGGPFAASITSVPTSNVYTGGTANSLFIGYGAQSTVLQTNVPAGTYAYAWSGADVAMLSNTNTANPTFTPTHGGSYNFTVTVTNALGCVTTASVSICVTDIRVFATATVPSNNNNCSHQSHYFWNCPHSGHGHSCTHSSHSSYNCPDKEDGDDHQVMCNHQSHNASECPHKGHNHSCDHRSHTSYKCAHRDCNDRDDDDDHQRTCDHKAHSSYDCSHRGHNHANCNHQAHYSWNCPHSSNSGSDQKVCNHQSHSSGDCNHSGHNHGSCNHKSHSASDCPHNGNGGTDGTDDDDEKKVYICHVPPGNPSQHLTLSIGVSAVAAHLANHPGDRLGSCDQAPCSGYTDNVKPTIDCSDNVTIAYGSSTSPVVTGSPEADDNSGDVVITYSDASTKGTNASAASYYNYVITRTWKATDLAGNYATCVQTITVQETTKPVITCPGNTTVACGSTAPEITGTATATDNSGVVSVTYTDAVSGNKTTRTWKATDPSGNYVTCVQTITVIDNVKPVITAAADVTVNCGSSTAPAATGTATASDNCSNVTLTYSDAWTGSNKLTRTWKATDASGNYATDVQVITIVDNVKPTITAPADKSISCGSSTAPNYCGGSATASDNCSSVTITYSDVTNGNVITRTWKATDASGNYATDAQIITVIDNVKPVISDVRDVTISCGTSTTPQGCGSVATATDNCSTPVVTYSDVTAGNRITRTWTATDAAGNTATSTQIITIVDNTKPVISDVADRTVSCGSTDPSITGTATATDACSTPVVTYTDVQSGNKITRTWKATDAAGNYATSTQVITVTDNVKPVITAPSDITVSCSSLTAPANTGSAVATDACSVPTVTYTDAQSGNKITRTWKATDASGNYATAVQVINVVDNVKPTITAPADKSINCGSSTAPSYCGGSATATDNCSSVSISYSDVTNGNVITRTWKATDASGNYATDVQLITIIDNVKPVISDVRDVTISCGQSTTPQGCGSVATATDNCSTPVVTYSDVTVGNKITRTWTATDAAGNTATSTQIITIVDNTKPVLTEPNDITINCGGSTAPSATGIATATDGCSTPVITYTDVQNGNVITRTWKATDAAGNYITDVQYITIGSSFTASITSAPTNSTYTGGVSTNLYLGYGAQSTTLTLCSLPSAGAPYTYVWNGGSYSNRLSSTTSASPLFTPATSGYYTFTVTVTNKYGCTSVASISICVTDIRVPGTNGAKVYVCHTPYGKNKTPQTLQVPINQVSSHLNTSSCGSDGYDRLGSCDQTPCNTTIVNTTIAGTTTVAKEAGEQVITTEEDLKVTVMPNPSTTYFTLKLESKYDQPVNLRVMDANGRVVDAKTKIGSNSSIQIGHNYASGTYYAELIQGTKRKVVQLIKARG